MLLICKSSLPIDLDGEGSNEPWSDYPDTGYDRLDDALLNACIRLLEQGPIPDAGIEATEIRYR